MSNRYVSRALDAVKKAPGAVWNGVKEPSFYVPALGASIGYVLSGDTPDARFGQYALEGVATYNGIINSIEASGRPATPRQKLAAATAAVLVPAAGEVWERYGIEFMKHAEFLPEVLRNDSEYPGRGSVRDAVIGGAGAAALIGASELVKRNRKG